KTNKRKTETEKAKDSILEHLQKNNGRIEKSELKDQVTKSSANSTFERALADLKKHNIIASVPSPEKERNHKDIILLEKENR
ncbi:MAG: hypothetical protein LUG21_05410, partial [Clostridiales bacterium]|nr:hypothetical protein [Clostridiales bacterium]